MVATFPPKSDYKVIGTRPIRHDGYDKVTGRAVYGGDVKLPGLIWGEVLRSPHAHAKIKKIDTSAAEKLPGVFAVITHSDLPLAANKEVEAGEGAVNFRRQGMNILAYDKALYKGHVVAAVAAIDRNTAKEAAKLIKVDYEPLTAVSNVRAATAKDAPILHPDMECDHLGEKVTGSNIARHFRHEFGDPDGAFDKCSLVVEREYELQMVHQGYIEPHNATALWDEEDRLTVWSSTQGAFGVRTQTAGILNVPESRVKVNPVEIGGGFGGKTVVYLPPIAALLSKKARRPVKLVMDRTSVFEATGPAPGGVIRAKLGVDKKGKLQAAEVDIKFEAGAFPGSAVNAAAICALSCYTIPNTRIDGYDIMVNKPKSAAYRAPGSPQAAFAVDQTVDELCDQLGVDKFQWRIDNAAKEGSRRGDGVLFGKIGIVETLEAARKSEHWNTPLKKSKDGKLRGRGIGAGYWMNGGGKSSAHLSLNSDGIVYLNEGSADIGGTRASISMQVAEVLGMDAHDIRPSIPDTENIGFTGVTGGSRTTYATGYAAWEAANNLVDELKKRAATLWGLDADSVEFADGVFSAKADPELRMNIKDLAERLDETGGPVQSTGSVNLSNAGNGYGVHICDLEIDPETGKTQVLRYTAVQDVGKAIHPAYAEGQIEGGAVQGIGWALNEEYFMLPDGRMANSSFLDYRMPTALDLPAVETIMVEVANPLHPFGVRGVGEVPIVPPLGAVPNAVKDATGIRFLKQPIKPGVILEALSQKK